MPDKTKKKNEEKEETENKNAKAEKQDEKRKVPEWLKKGARKEEEEKKKQKAPVEKKKETEDLPAWVKQASGIEEDIRQEKPKKEASTKLGVKWGVEEAGEEKPDIKVNGKPNQINKKDGYAQINRKWNKGDQITLHLPMPVRKVIAHEKVEADMGKFCIQRGPLVYAAEGVDNGGKVRNLLMDPKIQFNVNHNRELVDGVTILCGKATSLKKDKEGSIEKHEKKAILIPYYAWNHRGPNEMAVWFPYRQSAVSPTPPVTITSESKVTASYTHDAIKALKDLNGNYNKRQQK